MNDMEKDYLSHHGIKGQHWYIRRFQNHDGTLTPAGKQRYDKKVKKLTDRLNKQEKKSNKAIRDYEIYKQTYEAVDASARKTGPVNYARWYSSGAAYAQRNRMKQLKKTSERAVNKTNNLIRDLSEKYSLSYDVTNGNYSLKEKR